MTAKKSPPLRLQPDPFDVYYYAVSYNKSAARLGEQNTPAPYRIPMVVFQALSLEVFLKCIYRIRERDIPRHHDLKTLFDELDSKDRHSLESTFTVHVQAMDGNKDKLNLPDVLDRCKDLFEFVRYGYEGMPADADKVPINRGLPPAILSTQAFIKTLEPTYGPMAEAKHKM